MSESVWRVWYQYWVGPRSGWSGWRIQPKRYTYAEAEQEVKRLKSINDDPVQALPEGQTP